MLQGLQDALVASSDLQSALFTEPNALANDDFVLDVMDSIANLFEQSTRRRMLQQTVSISDVLGVKEGFAGILCQVMANSSSLGVQSFSTSAFVLYLEPQSANKTTNASYVYSVDGVTSAAIGLSDLIANDTICVQTTFYSAGLFNDSVYQRVQPLPLAEAKVWPGLNTEATVSYSFRSEEAGNVTLTCLAYSALDQAWGNESCTTTFTQGD
jgi:hypothetical protein